MLEYYYFPCRDNVAEAVNSLCRKAIEVGITVDWLFVWPLYNFMKAVSSPYMEPQYKLESIVFLKHLPRLSSGLVFEFKVLFSQLTPFNIIFLGLLMICMWRWSLYLLLILICCICLLQCVQRKIIYVYLNGSQRILHWLLSLTSQRKYNM